MFFPNPLINSGTDNIFHLAPVPVYSKVFDDHTFHDQVFDLGFSKLNDWQKRMGQELPEKYDSDRHSKYEVNYDRREAWVEPDEDSPVGSRFYTPPNDFLQTDDIRVKELVKRIKNGFQELTTTLGSTSSESIITESWMQFYDPTLGRGDNQHNHCRWGRNEGQTEYMFSGGYYLSDGEPVLDHPYSGAFAFHLRGHQYFIRPKKGMLVIWPYDIVHSVKPFYGKSHRCVINFNIQNVG
jgi:hypothetical protein